MPASLRRWWTWTAAGFDAWRLDVWTVIAWAFVVVALMAVSPLALVGVGCRRLVAAVAERRNDYLVRRSDLPRPGAWAAVKLFVFCSALKAFRQGMAAK